MRKFLRSKAKAVPIGFLPEIEIDRVLVRDRLKRAGLTDHEDAVIAFLQAALDDYRQKQIRDRHPAWPSQVNEFLVRMKKVELDLKLDRTEATTILKSTGVSLDELWQAQETVKRLVGDLETVLRTLPERAEKRGGRTAVLNDRQRDLAARFWGAFTTNGWCEQEDRLTERSLITQLLGHVLAKAGESRGTVSKLLKRAQEPNT